MPSITEVSKRADVSIATVSRVINKNPQVSPEAVEAVRRAMRDIGYVPPPPRRRYRGRPRNDDRNSGLQHGMISLLFPDNRDSALRTALSGRFLQAMTQNLSAKHINLVPCLLQEDGQLPMTIQKAAVDGVIVRGATDLSKVAVALANIPCVWLMSLNELPAHGDQVADDADAAGRLAAQYLLSRGRRRAVVVNHDPAHPCYRPRCEGFARAFAQGGGESSLLAGAPIATLARRAASLDPVPDSLFIPVPDKEIEIVYRTMAGLGRTPGSPELDTICVANDPARLHMLDGRLAGIDVQAEELSSAAIEMLLWRIRSPREPRRRLTIAPRLIEPMAV